MGDDCWWRHLVAMRLDRREGTARERLRIAARGSVIDAIVWCGVVVRVLESGFAMAIMKPKVRMTCIALVSSNPSVRYAPHTTHNLCISKPKTSCSQIKIPP